MKSKITLALLFVLFAATSKAQEYKVITSIESVVPMGLGRSRILENKTKLDAAGFTTERTDGKKSGQDEISRGDAKIDNFSETKLLNFYSAVGINFQNIASNDALITSIINTLVKDGFIFCPLPAPKKTFLLSPVPIMAMLLSFRLMVLYNISSRVLV